MGLLKNAQSRVATVLVSLFLGFVMPWVLQANRDFRGEAQFKFDPSAMFASTVAEVLVSIAFVAVFVISLLYLAKQSSSRKLLLFASAVSLVAFAGFAVTYSLFIHGSVYGWIYYALFQMFPGLILVVGYAVTAIVCSHRRS
jgi:ABC-type multidrug transport system fused ATPase/permease subunit